MRLYNHRVLAIQRHPEPSSTVNIGHHQISTPQLNASFPHPTHSQLPQQRPNEPILLRLPQRKPTAPLCILPKRIVILEPYDLRPGRPMINQIHQIDQNISTA
jgi:hypothetical protein